MSKRVYLFMLLVLSGNLLLAQKGLHLGFTSAVNSTWILNQNNYGTLSGFSDPIVRQSELAYKYKVGYQFGAQLTYNFSNHFGIMPELLFNKGGQDYEDNMQEGKTRINVKRNVDLSYFQIPISLKYTTIKGNRAKFYIHLGPQIGFLMSSKESVLIDGVPKEDSTGLSAKQKFTKVDIGMQLGTGVNIFVSEHFYIGIGLNTYLGFADINGKDIKGLDWFSKNDINYQRSKNFRAGLVVGFTYCFNNKLYIKKAKKI